MGSKPHSAATLRREAPVRGAGATWQERIAARRALGVDRVGGTLRRDALAQLGVICAGHPRFFQGANGADVSKAAGAAPAQDEAHGSSREAADQPVHVPGIV